MSESVFISYSHDNEEHANLVLRLANQLRADLPDHFEVVIDQWHPNSVEGWTHWMEKQITRARFVLLVCTETYYNRVTRKEEPGVGFGATWEATIIYNLLYKAQGRNEKFIPLLASDGSDEHIPLPLQDYTRYIFDTKEGYIRLLRRLTDQPEYIPPPPGDGKKLPPKPATGLFDKKDERDPSTKGSPGEGQPVRCKTSRFFTFCWVLTIITLIGVAGLVYIRPPTPTPRISDFIVEAGSSRPVRGVRLTILDLETGNTQPPSTRSGAKGCFTIPVPPAYTSGNLNLRIEKEGFETKRILVQAGAPIQISLKPERPQ